MSQPRNHDNGASPATFRRRIRALLTCWGTRSVKCKSFILFMIVVMGKILHSQLDAWFGFGTMKGGTVGQYLDGRIRRYNIRTNIQTKTDELAELGVELPLLDIRNNRFIKETPSPFGQLAERMSRTAKNNKNLKTAQDLAERWKQDCQQSPLHSPFPPQVLQPIVGDWYRHIVYSTDLSTIPFDEDAIVRFVKLQFPDIVQRFNSINSETTRVQLFSLLSLYWYGGYTLGPFVGNSTVLVGDAASLIQGPACIDRIVLYQSSLGIAMIAATPRNPSLLCFIEKISTAPLQSDLDLAQLLVSYLFSGYQSPAGDAASPHTANQTTFTNVCALQGTSPSCDTIQGSTQPNYDNAAPASCQGYLAFRISSILPRGAASIGESAVPPKQVEVVPGEPSGAAIAKTPIERSLRKMNAWPSWLCNRCLKTMLYGSFQACSFVCNKAYVDSQCRDDTRKEPKDAASVRTRNSGTLGTTTKTRIPKIIHQTWHSDMNLETHPELSRLQNGWVASGFEYRFYNDTEARSYIVDNFPPFFVDCYDAIIPGAFKADLFRLLVLLKDGGVYADVDVQLETSLSSFITPDMSLFIPRETVRDLVGSDYCLWNGLIGSSPGHPVIAKAVERLLVYISTRADYFDVEKYACEKDGPSTPLWKIRALPTLILSGPCALGMAFNEVLGRNLLSDLQPGWAVPQEGQSNLDLGSMLILMADKRDMGHFRFSDIERNLLVASTDMPDMSKQSLLDSKTTGGMMRGRPHYSETEFASDVFGAKGVYADNQAIQDTIRIQVIDESP